MPKIWKQNQDVSEKPNRNNFDLRYQNHLTMKMGTIYPIMCKECVPGDSFRIDTAFGLKFMPLVFPVQSHMRAHVHYFYVPNRILWSNWKNYLEGLEEHEHPYISQPTSWFKTGSLCDYMDVPTATVGVTSKVTTGMSRSFGFEEHLITSRPRRGLSSTTARIETLNIDISGIYSVGLLTSLLNVLQSNGTPFFYRDSVNVDLSFSRKMYFFDSPLNALYDTGDYSTCSKFSFEIPNLDSSFGAKLVAWRSRSSTSIFPNIVTTGYVGSSDLEAFAVTNVLFDNPDSNSSFVDVLHDNSDPEGSAYASFVRRVRESQDDGYYCFISFCGSLGSFPNIGSSVTKSKSIYCTGRFRYRYDSKVVDSTYTNPFANDLDGMQGEPVVRLNALPFRAYESVYWSYFSNTQNQGFYIDGVQKFNRWNTTLDDGADTTDYHLFRRNYELDFLTSALPSPQFGAAPLVGMTALGDITVEDDINGVSTFHAEVDNDGNITKVVATSPVASISHARTAMNLAAVGMNINDFRATNSFQRFLEQSMRSGYRYIDFIKGHFGVSPKRVELDMPVYIGGTSQDVSVNMISNMTAGQIMNDKNVPLGAFAGTANCFGQSKHQVSHFCDDYGWIIGVMCVVPDPAYSQLLPKQFLHDQRLSYYFPQFAQNGMQPITYKEVCPLTAYQDYLADNTKLLTDTFGYQRPYYDLVGYTDQVHGLFRTDLKDFLVHRIFETRPELGTDFLEIKPEEVNDIFAYQDPSTDTILGQVIVDVKAKRPVPRVVVPALGR